LDFICGHHDIKDVVFNSYQKSKKGLSADELTEKFKNVPILLGHYHNQSITRGCRYMGTLFQHSWGEYGFRKGFWVIGDDKKINFIDSNDHFPKHIRIEYTQEGKKQPTYYISDGISDVICTTDYNLVKEFVSKNHIEFIAEKYDSETKYNQLILDLSNTSYGDFNVINNKRLSKAIAQLLDVTEEECGEDDIKNNSNIIELCQYFLNSLPESLENKKEIIKLFDEKISKL
jgi:hypothetical protein